MKNQNEKTHWLSSPNKNYLGHWDLPENKDLVLTVKEASFKEVINPTVSKSSPQYSKIAKVIEWVEDYKPMIINQVNSKSIYLSTGIRNMEDSEGAKIALYIGQTQDKRTREVVDCIRIRAKKYEEKESKKDLPTITDSRLNDAIKAIEKGSFTVATFKSKYSLTEEQKAKLPNE